MNTPPQTEAWQRGPVQGFDPLVMPVVHALIQAGEDLDRLATQVPAAHVWTRPGGAASIGFHVRHLGGALDRLFTYARGEMLSDEQRAVAKTESDPGDPAATLDTLVAEAKSTIARALDQLRATPAARLAEPREIGRAKLPTTVMGLLFHAAEHAARHTGQAATTALVQRPEGSSGAS